MTIELRSGSFAWCFSVGVFGVAAAIAVGCGSSNDRVVPDADAGASAGGHASASGGEPNVDAGGSSTGPGSEPGGAGGGATEPGVGGAAAASNGGEPGGQAGEGGAGGGAFVPEPITVDSFGCFFATGDGGDFLISGEPATIVTSSPHSAACGTSWISDNASAYSPKDPPTTLSFTRAFILDESVANGSVQISFKADDAIEFVLNGEVIADCMPPAGNAGECQQSCKNVFLDEQLLRGNGETNTLEFRLINLQSTPAGGENYGWTAVSYEVCITPPS